MDHCLLLLDTQYPETCPFSFVYRCVSAIISDGELVTFTLSEHGGPADGIFARLCSLPLPLSFLPPFNSCFSPLFFPPSIFFCFVCFPNPGDWTQVLMHASQVWCHWPTHPDHWCSSDSLLDTLPCSHSSLSSLPLQDHIPKLQANPYAESQIPLTISVYCSSSQTVYPVTN